MTVVDLATGQPVDEPPETPNLINSLRQIIARVESGELDVENFYLIAECKSGQTHSLDSNLTAAEAIVLLEREKFHILCALHGVGV